MFSSDESLYISQKLPRVSRSRKPVLALVALLLSIFTLAPLLTLVEPISPASAETSCDSDDNCDAKTLNEAFGDKYDYNEDGFDKLMNDMGDGSTDENSILYAFTREFTLGYMNEGNHAVVASSDAQNQNLDWYGKIFANRNNYNCGKGYRLSSGGSQYYPGENTNAIYWHNCDVPNLLTEFSQDVASLFLQSGFADGEAETSYSDTPWFGYSSNTPRHVRQDSADAVTALEVFGYNLRYTTYRGEWDHVKVMTAARALANFGFLDKLKLGAQAVLNGVLGGVNDAVTTLASDLKSGNIARIVTSPLRSIGSFFGGGTSATVDTVIDTSDTNVFATYAWYRPDFGATLYNARALSQDEIVDFIQTQLARYILSLQGARSKASAPADLTAIDPDVLSKLPHPNPGQCSATGSYVVAGGASTPINWNHPEAINDEATCKNALKAERKAVKAAAGAPVTFNIDETFLPAVTVAQWSAAANWASAVKKYNITCSLTDSSSTDPSVVETFLNCLRDPDVGYAAAVKRATAAEQSTLDQSWFTDSFDDKKVADYFRKQTNTFSSPNARYICLNTNGTDMKDKSGNLVHLVIGSQGNERYNPACGPVRSPIQNGLFGNGYVGQQPPVDTRRSAFQPSLWDLLHQDEYAAQLGLGLCKFTTRVSNAVLNLSFAPLLQTLGLDTLMATLIQGFRDSLFFPLAVLVIALGAFSIFFQAGVRRDYGAQGKSLLLIAGVFICGVVVMASPLQTIHFVDEAPAQVEALVTGSIFDVGNNRQDPLCNASTPQGTVGAADYAGNVIHFDPSAASRNIICENWKTFALNPYIYGQWGTSYDNLNYDQFHAVGAQNKLVGDGVGNDAPYVALGKNNGVRNWGLYQLDLMTAGTSTDASAQHSNNVDPNMYRLVDLQAGPGGLQANAPYNDDYYEMWRGDNSSARIFVAWLGALSSTVGMIAVCLLAFAKIQISLMSMLMLLFIPFMFLIGLLPNQGRYKLKGYFAQLVSLMVQRVVLVGMIALLLRIITGVGQSSQNYFYCSVLTIATCVAFLAYRKEILSLFDRTIVGGTGGFALRDHLTSYLPKTAQQSLTRFRVTGRAAAYGAIGGFMAGGVSGARAASAGFAQRQGNMLSMKQARDGLPGAVVAANARKRAQDRVQGELDKYMDSRLKPAAEQTAREQLPEDADDVAVRQRTQEELNRMRPSSNAAYRDISRLRRSEEQLYETPKRSPEQVRESLNATTTDAVTEQVDQLKPTLTENEQAIEAHDEALGKVAKRVADTYAGQALRDETRRRTGERLRESLPDAVSTAGRVAGNPSEASTNWDNFISREEERAQDHEVRKEMIRESAQQIMETFTDNRRDDNG